MAARKMTTVAFLVFACALAGVSHGEEETCSTDKVEVFSKLVSCVTKKHPEYLLVILTKMDSPAGMENPNFMCSHQGLMTGISECLLDYIKGCMPTKVASQVAQVLPTEGTIQKGIQFLCQHRNDFNDQCIESRLPRLGQCIGSKMQSFSRVTRSTSPQTHMRNALCFALKQEEMCLEESLAGCPTEKVASIKKALMAFFPHQECSSNLSLPKVLLFHTENRRH